MGQESFKFYFIKIIWFNMTGMLIIILALLCVYCCSNVAVTLTESEARHTKQKYILDLSVLEFQQSKYNKSKNLHVNDFSKHHKLVRKFCLSKRQKCTWDEYYFVLDYIRKPYVNMYDPGIWEKIFCDKNVVMSIEGAGDGSYISAVQDYRDDVNKRPLSCEVIDNPSAESFFKMVSKNIPVIFKGIASEWPAVRKWSDTYLTDRAGSREVRV